MLRGFPICIVLGSGFFDVGLGWLGDALSSLGDEGVYGIETREGVSNSVRFFKD